MPTLPRAHLLNHLERVLQVAVTTIQAPAGCGKTMLLRHWHEASGLRGVERIWLSLDRRDRDAPTLVAALAYAAHHHGVGKQTIRRAVRQADLGVHPAQVLKTIMQGLAETARPIVLFLDDYHLAENSEQPSPIDDLVQEMPANVHLILATQTRPHLPLSSLRARGDLFELTADDLRFRDAETARFLSGMFNPEEAALLGQRTEGWPMALQIARIWAGEQPDAGRLVAGLSGSAADIAAYMLDALMSRLPAPLGEMLIRTSIVDAIDGDIANHLCERDDCWPIFKELDRLSPLIFPIDADKTQYRHHHHFAEFLQSRLARLGETERRRLHLRAAAWFEEKGLILEAVEHARAADDVEAALTILNRAELLRRMLEEGEARYRAFKMLSTSLALDRYPRVAAAQALLRIRDGELREARALLEGLREKLNAGHYDEAAVRNVRLDGDIRVMEAFLSNYMDSGVGAETVAAMEAQLGTIDPDDHWYLAIVNNLLCIMYFHRGDLFRAMKAAEASIEQFSLARIDHGLFFMSLHQGGFLLLSGNATGADACARHAERIMKAHFRDDPAIRANWRIFSAELAYERNRLAEAGRHILDAISVLGHADGWAEAHLSAYRVALGVAYARDGLAGIEPVLATGRRFARRHGLARLKWFLRLWEIHYNIVAESLESAQGLVDACTDALEGLCAIYDEAQIWREREAYQTMLARLMIAEGRFDEAAASLEPLLIVYADKGHMWRLAQTLTQCAIAEWGRGNEAVAAHHLGRALRLTRGARLLRLFVEEGAPAGALMEAMIPRIGTAHLPEDFRRWMYEIRDAVAGRGLPSPGPVGSLLTPRENEVYALLQDGKSNKIIARELSITDNGVKYHLKNIYRKLGVNNRRRVASGVKEHEDAGAA